MPAIGHYVVGLFDLLGQSAELASFASLPGKDSDEAGYREKILAVLKKLRTFRETFVAFFDGHSKPRTEGLTDLLTPEQRKQLDDWRGPEVQLMQFSDTVIAFVPVFIGEDQFSIHGLSAMLAAAASTTLLQHGEGVPVRGAIEIGVATDFAEKEVYGPALAEAYRLESTCAEWPRIVVGPVAVQFIQECEGKEVKSIAGKMNQRMARICKSLLMMDVDGMAIVDYLGEGFLAQMVKSDINRESFERGLRFAQEQHRRFREQANRKLAIRYDRMAQYYEGRADLWKA